MSALIPHSHSKNIWAMPSLTNNSSKAEKGTKNADY
jgi:hypothetical protein